MPHFCMTTLRRILVFLVTGREPSKYESNEGVLLCVLFKTPSYLNGTNSVSLGQSSWLQRDPGLIPGATIFSEK
jgi:hypothetical protein